MAGRALWQEAAPIADREKRLNFLRSITVNRLVELNGLANKWAKPWYAGLGFSEGRFPEPAEGWYRTYGQKAGVL